MEKKLGRLFWPSLWMYFLVMAGFAVAALVTRNYILAGAEAGVTALLVLFYVVSRTRRRKTLTQFAKSALTLPETAGGVDMPFPMALIRLGDGAVIWANDRFGTITGYQDKYLEQNLKRILPDFSTDWLASGKNEYPYDVTLSGRRYRIYGNIVRRFRQRQKQTLKFMESVAAFAGDLEEQIDF